MSDSVGKAHEFNGKLIQENELRESAQHWLDASWDFFRTKRRLGFGAAVVWVAGTCDELVIFTRGEYKDSLLQGITKVGKDIQLTPPEEQMDDIHDSDKFDFLTTKLNKLLRRAEEKCIDIGNGFHFAMLYKEEMNPYVDSLNVIQFYLGMQKHRGKWVLANAELVRKDKLPIKTNDLPWKPLWDCDLSIRIDATQHIPQFIDSLTVARSEFMHNLHNAIASLQEHL